MVLQPHCRLFFPINWVSHDVSIINVNPGLINHGLLIRVVLLQIVAIWYINGTLPLEQPRGLLIQG